jgi:hypothetical protein
MEKITLKFKGGNSDAIVSSLETECKSKGWNPEIVKEHKQVCLILPSAPKGTFETLKQKLGMAKPVLFMAGIRLSMDCEVENGNNKC